MSLSVRVLLLLSVPMVLMSPYAQAQEKQDSVVRVEKKAPVKQQADVQKWIAAENAMIDKLSADDKETVYILRSKYATMRAVRMVEGDVGLAVKSCGKANPDMESAMEGRFADWKKAVNPILDTANKQLQKDIDAQKIVSAKEFRSVMALQDKASDVQEKKIQKIPVSTKESCQGLLESMDRTEDDIIQLLRKTLLTESVIKTRSKIQKKQDEKPIEKGSK